MKKIIRKALVILKWFGIVLLSIILLFFIVRNIGRAINRITPEGGINEEMYLDINGTKQWISIYGQDKNNPVLLFLHGGPGDAMSYADYAILRKLSDVYTVVEWDQRGCGKSWSKDLVDKPVTKEDMFTDSLELTEFLREYLGKDKITLMGISWGSLLGANLVLDYPEYYDGYIGLSQVVSNKESNISFKKHALEWSKDNPEIHKYAEELTEGGHSDVNFKAYFMVYREYVELESYTGGDIGIAQGASWVIFSPYHSIFDYHGYLNRYDTSKQHNDPYYPLIMGKDGCDSIALSGRFDYEVPVYILMGDNDCDVMTDVAENYFDNINAPDKMMRLTSGGHFAPMINYEDLSEFVHEVAKRQQQ